MKRYRIVVAALLVLGLAFASTGCSSKNIAARVNGEAITMDQLDEQVEQLKKQYPQMFEGADGEGRLIDFKQRLLDNLINQKLVEQASKERKIEVSDTDVKQQVEQLKAGFKDEEQFTQALESAGMDVGSLENQIREQLLTQKLIESLADDESVTDADIEEYYEKNQAQFQQKEAKRASHILLKPEDKDKAESVLKQVKDGGDFNSLAKANSIDTATAENGGDLGWPSTPYVPEFQSALDTLKVGQTSELVQSPYGWHIIRVTDEREGSQQTLEEVTDQVKQIIVQQRRADAYQKFVDELRANATIEILIEELKTTTAPAPAEGEPSTDTPAE